LKGIKRKDINFILECLHWNKYNYSQKQSTECYHKEETLNKMCDIENKLKEAIK